MSTLIFFKSQMDLFGSGPKKEVQAPGSRGGKTYHTKTGHLAYGQEPRGEMRRAAELSAKLTARSREKAAKTAETEPLGDLHHSILSHVHSRGRASLGDLRSAMGHKKYDHMNPQGNAVNRAVKRLRAEGLVNVQNQIWGEPDILPVSHGQTRNMQSVPAAPTGATREEHHAMLHHHTSSWTSADHEDAISEFSKLPVLFRSQSLNGRNRITGLAR